MSEKEADSVSVSSSVAVDSDRGDDGDGGAAGTTSATSNHEASSIQPHFLVDFEDGPIESFSSPIRESPRLSYTVLDMSRYGEERLVNVGNVAVAMWLN